MTLEAVENQEVEVVDEAAFAAGFDETRGEEPPVESQASEEVQVTEEEPPVAEEPQQTLIAGLTEEQVKSLLLKAGEVDKLSDRIEKAFGKHGEAMRAIQQLQQQRSGGVQLNASALKRLSSEFPEMAEMLASDLSEAFAGQSGGAAQPSFDPELIEQHLQGRVADVRAGLEQDMEKRLLKREHRDWETVVTSDDFKLWKDNVLPPEDSAKLGASWDSDFISEKLDEFKAWRNKSSVSKENKQKRLESAVTPRGGSGQPSTIQSEEEAFASAFKHARGG
jgi:hypothetical protein